MAYSITTHGSAPPTGVSSITQSVTVSTAGSTLLVFAQAYDGTVSNTIISGVTYNGVSLTRVDNAPSDSGSGSAASFMLQNVAAGTHNLVVTFAGTCSNPTVSWTVVSGVATSGGADNHAFAGDTAFNATTGLTVNVTPVAAGAFVWSCCDVYSGGSLALGGSNMTSLDFFNGNYNGQAYVTNPVTGAVSCTWKNGTTTHGDIFVISLAPSSGTTPNTGQFFPFF